MHIMHWDQAAVWTVVLQGGWLAPEAGRLWAAVSVEKIPPWLKPLQVGCSNSLPNIWCKLWLVIISWWCGLWWTRCHLESKPSFMVWNPIRHTNDRSLFLNIHTVQYSEKLKTISVLLAIHDIQVQTGLVQLCIWWAHLWSEMSSPCNPRCSMNNIFTDTGWKMVAFLWKCTSISTVIPLEPLSIFEQWVRIAPTFGPRSPFSEVPDKATKKL